MAEWFKAPVLKTGLVKANVGSNPSPSAIQSQGQQLKIRGGAGVAERDRLLSDCRALNSTGGSNPPLPAIKIPLEGGFFFISLTNNVLPGVFPNPVAYLIHAGYPELALWSSRLRLI